jgi:uncharacterized protein YxeA
MKKILTSFLLFLVLIGVNFVELDSVQARSYRTKSSDVHVKGYYRKNGTYVQPHYRSKADSSVSNNYSCIDYGQCGKSTSSSYKLPKTAPVPTYVLPSATLPIKSTVKQKVDSFIAVDYIGALYRATNNAFYITGKTSNNCSKIQVNALNLANYINDDYFLANYHYGDTVFKYGMREDWNNLGIGSNSYTFKAYCDDGTKEVVETINFTK